MRNVLSILVAAGAASVAGAAVPTMTVFSQFLPGGDFVAASGSSRSSAGVPDPFVIGMPALPGGSFVVRSYACWNYLTNSPGLVDEPHITLNGFNVVGGANFAPPDLCWGYQGIATYLADVTGLVNHGGPNVIGSAVDDPFTLGLGEGVSLLTVYAGTGPLRNVDVFWDGVPGLIANNQVDPLNRWIYDAPYPGGPAHGFTNALDGQPAGDDFVINGGIASGLYGTFAVGDAWIGNVGPYYDHAEGDFSPFMTPGDLFMDIGSVPMFNDCIGHTFGAIAFAPAPGSLALVGVGMLVAARRRR